jgi:LacI family repressor for deo operon, udp, cdd, tsx, nupC, and nupG
MRYSQHTKADESQVHMVSRNRSRSSDRVTIDTVAEAAGVSIATVSRVMSGSTAVKPALADRVREAAEALSYRPSSAARGLALGSLRNVGVIVPDLTNAYFFEITKQMHSGAAAGGYRVLVADYSGQPADELQTAKDLLGHVDGLFLQSSRIDADGLRWLAAQKTPIVLVNRMELGVDLPMVAIDTFSAMMEVLAHLSGLGHRRLVYVAGSDLAWQNRERERAIGLCHVFGMEAQKVSSDGTIETGYGVVDEALTHDPTALVCFNDLTAIGVTSRLRELGISVPRDMSVTGFDDIAIARHVDPALTTVKSPTKELGQQAWALMQQALAGQTPERLPLVKTEIVIRQSSAAPPAR